MVSGPYSVSKKLPPPPQTFSKIFTQAKCISVKFCQFVASVYPYMLTSLGRFLKVFNKMALIFLGVLIQGSHSPGKPGKLLEKSWNFMVDLEFLI